MQSSAIKQKKHNLIVLFKQLQPLTDSRAELTSKSILTPMRPRHSGNGGQFA